MTPLVALVVVNLALWCIGVGVLIGIHVSRPPARRLPKSERATRILRTSHRLTKIA